MVVVKFISLSEYLWALLLMNRSNCEELKNKPGLMEERNSLSSIVLYWLSDAKIFDYDNSPFSSIIA